MPWMIVPSMLVNRQLFGSAKSLGIAGNIHTIFKLNSDRFVRAFHEKPTMEGESQSGDSDGSLEKEFELSACQLKGLIVIGICLPDELHDAGFIVDVY